MIEDIFYCDLFTDLTITIRWPHHSTQIVWYICEILQMVILFCTMDIQLSFIFRLSLKYKLVLGYVLTLVSHLFSLSSTALNKYTCGLGALLIHLETSVHHFGLNYYFVFLGTNFSHQPTKPEHWDLILVC